MSTGHFGNSNIEGAFESRAKLSATFREEKTLCGVVGILNKRIDKPVERNLLEKMNDIISHRGPDGHGVYCDANVGLGHRRLSILDIHAGQQPMVDTQSGRAIVYNGELYNYLDIKADLEKRGERFQTTCDTEVLLKTPDLGSPHVLESFNGMFAFAIWDSRSKSLMLVRDRLGIKPLYYIDTGDKFLFSSEIKSLLLHPEVTREPNADKLYEFVAYRTLAGDGTMFKGIHQIPPGHIARLRAPAYKLELEAYWSEGDNRDAADYANAGDSFVEQFDAIFRDAVNSRLISDVPLGTFNSGGVDSSLVSSIVRSHKPDELHTFSAGFEEESHDERAYAQIVAKQLGTKHHTIVLNEFQYCDGLEEALWHLDEPINHAHSVQILQLSRLAKQFVTVVLTGEGADELFAGYPRYNMPKLAFLTPRAVRKGLSRLIRPIAESLSLRRVVKLSEAFSLSDENLVTDNARYVSLQDLQRLNIADMAYPCRAEVYRRSHDKFDNQLQTQLYFDQRTYLSSLLMRLDRMSMAASVEARVPFLDYRLVEWSYKIPADVKLRYLRNKWLVKKSAENWLPKNIVHRKKVGFGAPLSKWMRNGNGLGRYLEMLKDRRSRERGYFDQKIVSQLIDDHLKKKSDHSEILWGLLNLELWHRMFIDDFSASASRFPR